MRKDSHCAEITESQIHELTKSIESGNYTHLNKFLKNITHPAARIEVLKRIEIANHQNRYKSGLAPRLAVETRAYPDSDFVDITLLKKSSDWLFQDDVLYRESIVWQH